MRCREGRTTGGDGVSAQGRKALLHDAVNTSGGVRLLFVEDTATHRDLMLMALAKARPEWTVDAFWSAEDALEPARQRVYDAAILDFTLPGMTGLDLAEELRRLTPDLPIVLVTARGSEKIAARALRTGVSEYLMKEGDYLDILPLAISKAIETVAGARERERIWSRYEQGQT